LGSTLDATRIQTEQDMGLLDGIVNALTGAMTQSGSQALPGALSQILGGTNLGNIGGLLAQLQQGGLDRQVASWLGSGSNMPVSPDQLRSALGDQHLQQMSSSAGLPIDELMKVLAHALPGAVDRMSPHGALQEPTSDGDGSEQGDAGSLAEQAGLSDIK
jgi:uncharacterized protein YidB (DUF937 family)